MKINEVQQETMELQILPLPSAGVLYPVLALVCSIMPRDGGRPKPCACPDMLIHATRPKT